MGILNAVVYYILTHVFNGGIDPALRWKVFVSAVAVTLVYSAGARQATALWHLGLALLLAGIVSVACLVLWLKVSRNTALKVTGSYLGITVALSIAVTLLLPNVSGRGHR